MIEYTHGGWMPPHEPSASWRCDDPPLGTRERARRRRTVEGPALVAVQQAVEEAEACPPTSSAGADARPAARRVRSSSIEMRDRPDGAVARTTIESATTVWRAQQAKS